MVEPEGDRPGEASDWRNQLLRHVREAPWGLRLVALGFLAVGCWVIVRFLVAAFLRPVAFVEQLHVNLIATGPVLVFGLLLVPLSIGLIARNRGAWTLSVFLLAAAIIWGLVTWLDPLMPGESRDPKDLLWPFVPAAGLGYLLGCESRPWRLSDGSRGPGDDGSRGMPSYALVGIGTAALALAAQGTYLFSNPSVFIPEGAEMAGMLFFVATMVLGNVLLLLSVLVALAGWGLWDGNRFSKLSVPVSAALLLIGGVLVLASPWGLLPMAAGATLAGVRYLPRRGSSPA